MTSPREYGHVGPLLTLGAFCSWLLEVPASSLNGVAARMKAQWLNSYT